MDIAPVVVKEIPAQTVNEQAAYGPFDLNEFIKTPDGGEKPRFSASLLDGRALPTGLICTADGIVTGIPARETNGHHEIVITAENSAGKIETTFILTIKPSIAQGAGYLDKLKAQVWEALQQHLPIPSQDELMNLPVTVMEVDHLLERWGILRIWDAFNLNPPGDRVILTLEDASPHYQIYDMGSCLVAFPLDLFSHERTLEDGLKTARALAREAYKREWTVELVGYDKFTRAAWIELQHLGDRYGKRLEVINYYPSTNDVNLYAIQAEQKGRRHQPE